MSAIPQSMSATSLDRRIQMLRTAMGPLGPVNTSEVHQRRGRS